MVLTFFGLTPQYKSILFSQIHDLVYHGGGGFIHSDVYNMPVWLRIFHINKYTPTGWIVNYIPLEYTFTKGKDKITQVFEHTQTNYSEVKLTEGWLMNKWYDFGFLEEWGSFAFEGHVHGDVIVSTKDGSYNVDANETFEQYESKDFEGKMFDD